MTDDEQLIAAHVAQETGLPVSRVLRVFEGIDAYPIDYSSLANEIRQLMDETGRSRALLKAAVQFEAKAAHHKRIERERQALNEAITQAQLILSVSEACSESVPRIILDAKSNSASSIMKIPAQIDVRQPTYFLAIMETFAEVGLLHDALRALGYGVDAPTAQETVAIARRLAQTDPLWFQRVPYERWLDEMVAIAQKRISNQEKELEVSTGTA